MNIVSTLFFKHVLKILSFSLFLLASLGLGSVHAQEWDSDGGVSEDYSDIPRLQWVGSEPPDTYEEYMLTRDKRPFEIKSVYRSSEKRASGKALVLVNETLFPGIETRLNVYVSDLETDGYTVEMYATEGGTPTDYRNYFISVAADLAGCVLIGDHPTAWYEMDIWSHEEFPMDLYIMDLDGDWGDSDGDGKWDSHTAGTGDQGPEIFVGHIDASMMSGDEVEMTNDYLDKNHAFRTGQISLPGFGLTYTEDDWANFSDMRTNIKHSYPQFEQIRAPDTTKTDYITNRVPNPEYGFIQLACHSSSTLHQFTRGGNLINSVVRAKRPSAVFFNLFCCSSLRFTKNNFLGGSYIYDAGERCLAVIGSTKTGSMLVFYAFYQPFGEGQCFGAAFRQWFNHIAPYNNNEKAWHFGMTIAGDPFLCKREPALSISLPDGLPAAFANPGLETPIRLMVEDRGENLVPGSTCLHYRFSPAEAYTTVPATDLGGGFFEATIPRTSGGDEPQFYFTAEGDQGGINLLPHNAPEAVFDFEVALTHMFFADDFEADQGWSVINLMMDSGMWERGAPEQTTAQPGSDHSSDGTLCFVTGKQGGGADDHDVDGVSSFLYSPKIELGGNDALIRFYVWFYHSTTGIEWPLDIFLASDGGALTEVMSLEHNPQWSLVALKVSDYITPPQQLQLAIRVADYPHDDIVEALIDDVEVVISDASPSLWADAYSVSTLAGADIDFYLDAGAQNKKRNYLLLGSISGTSPGTPLPDGSCLPLNWDDLTETILIMLNTSIFTDFVGQLDHEGCATVALLTGGLHPQFAGIVMHFAYVLGPAPYFVSNPLAIPLVE